MARARSRPWPTSSGVSSQLAGRIGAKPLLVADSALAAGGMFWLSRITEHSSYAGGLLGPMLVAALGLGMLFMPVPLVALSKVADRDVGLASSLVNTGEQVGGSIGLAILGTVAWTVAADTVRNSVAAARATAARATAAGDPSSRQPLSWPDSRRRSPTTRWPPGSPAVSRSRQRSWHSPSCWPSS
jgi:hypothetical protein